MWLRNCYNTYFILYESGELTDRKLYKAGGLFFDDLNTVYIEYIYLSISRLTDPDRSSGRENLSVLNLNKQLIAVELMTEDIQKFSEPLQDFGNSISGVRNRLIAHNDRETHLKDLKLGETSRDAVVEFFDYLQLYCDEVGRATGVGPLDFRTQPGPGDVIDFIRSLPR